MKVIKVQQQPQGYKVTTDDEKECSIPYILGTFLYKETKAFIDGGGIIEPEFTDKDLNKTRITNIKAKARKIIEAKYPIFWQLNNPRMDSAFASDYAWIDNIRAISNVAEINGTLIDDIDWGI